MGRTKGKKAELGKGEKWATGHFQLHQPRESGSLEGLSEWCWAGLTMLFHTHGVWWLHIGHPREVRDLRLGGSLQLWLSLKELPWKLSAVSTPSSWGSRFFLEEGLELHPRYPLYLCVWRDNKKTYFSYWMVCLDRGNSDFSWLIWHGQVFQNNVRYFLKDLAYDCRYKNIKHCFVDHTSKLISGSTCRIAVRWFPVLNKITKPMRSRKLTDTQSQNYSNLKFCIRKLSIFWYLRF